MSQTLSATAPDSYSNNGKADIQGTILIPKMILDVTNNPVYWQLLKSVGGGGYWESSETPMFPGSRVIREPEMVGIRIRAYTPLASIPTGQIQAFFVVRAVY